MTGNDVLQLVLVLVAVAAFAAVVVLALHLGERRTPARRAPSDPVAPAPATPDADAPQTRRRAAVVVNPTKFTDVEAARREVTDACTELGWAEPLWLETTADDPGTGQAAQALREGVDMVLACGGDGTVRSVGEALVGTGVPLGLLPAGTGNLLARNLDMDLDDLGPATRTALLGENRPVDVGRVTVDDSDHEQVFLVMAGLGFDAEVMAHAPEALKAKVGPIAYTVSGLRNLKGEQARVRICVDDEEEIRRRVRTVVIGNCGRLLGGLVLMPDAEIDDGWLDVVSIAPEGIIGWMGVAGRVITKQRKGNRRVEHFRARTITIRSEQPQPSQLDGDPIGDVTVLSIRVEPEALLVRVPPAEQVPVAARPGHA